MTIQSRNNNKSFPNNFLFVQPAAQGTSTITFYCFNCKIFYDHATLGANRLKLHVRDLHLYTDSG